MYAKIDAGLTKYGIIISVTVFLLIVGLASSVGNAHLTQCPMLIDLHVFAKVLQHISYPRLTHAWNATGIKIIS
jgi:uncharacterized membrane protein